MATVNPDDLFAVNRDDTVYSVEQQNLMASLENTDYLAVNRDDVPYNVPGQEFLTSIIVPTTPFQNIPSTAVIISSPRKQMASYKIPRLVEFVTELPRSGSGKIQWRLLQEAEWQHHS